MRFSFYNSEKIGYSRGNPILIVPKYMRMGEALESLGSIEFNGGWRTNSLELILPDGLTGGLYNKIKKSCSYMIATSSAGGRDYHYFVEQVEELGGDVLNNALRLVLTHDWWGDAVGQDTSNIIIRGRVIQSNVVTMKDWKSATGKELTCQLTPIAYPDNSIAEPERRKIQTSGRCATVVIVATEGGEIVPLIFLEAYFADVVSIAKLDRLSIDHNLENVSIVRAYIIPEEWINTYGHGRVEWIAYDVNNKKIADKIDIFQPYNIESAEPLTLVFAGNIGDPFSDDYFVTPARKIKLPKAYSMTDGETNNASVTCKYRIYFAPSCAENAVGADSLRIVLSTNDPEYIDISSDYEIDFAVNEAALRQTQQKEFTAIKGIAAVVGAVGGAVGGVASGNYFGAVQSMIGGVSGALSPVFEKKNPATVKSQGGALNCSLSEEFPAFGLLSYKAPSAPAVDVTKQYGWSFIGGLEAEITHIENFSQEQVYIKTSEEVEVHTTDYSIGSEGLEYIRDLLIRGTTIYIR